MVKHNQTMEAVGEATYLQERISNCQHLILFVGHITWKPSRGRLETILGFKFHYTFIEIFRNRELAHGFNLLLLNFVQHVLTNG